MSPFQAGSHLRYSFTQLQLRVGSPTQQEISLTSPAGMVYTFSFSFVLVCLVIIDTVHQGDDQLSHPLLPCQCCTWVTVWCNGAAVLCVVKYLMVRLFAFNHARTTTVHTWLGTSICVTSSPAHLRDCLPSVQLGGS